MPSLAFAQASVFLINTLLQFKRILHRIHDRMPLRICLLQDNIDVHRFALFLFGAVEDGFDLVLVTGVDRLRLGPGDGSTDARRHNVDDDGIGADILKMVRVLALFSTLHGTEIDEHCIESQLIRWPGWRQTLRSVLSF